MGVYSDKVKEAINQLDIDEYHFKTFDELIDIEGGYVNDPDDPGGETKFGVTKKTAMDYGYTGEMEDLTIKEAIEIYYEVFFVSNKLHLLESSRVAGEVFEQIVNFWSKAKVHLQQAHNIINPSEPIIVDGIIGTQTVDAINELEPDRVFLVLNALQARYYVNLTLENPEYSKYIYGYLKNRVFNF